MISMGDEGITPRQRTSQLSAGLGLISGVIIDQHFGQRARYGRLMSMVAASNLIGIGIDEDTAIEVVDRRTFTVHGRGAVFVLDRRTADSDAPEARRGAPMMVSGAVVHSLPAGATFDLHEWLIEFVEKHPDAAVTLASSQARRPPLFDRKETLYGTRAPDPDRPGAAPELTIVESRIHQWQHLVLRPGHPPRPRPGRAGGLPDRHLLDGFTDRLIELLPGLENHTCSRGVKGGFIERLREGTWLGHVIEHVALQLQQEAGHDIRRGKTWAVKGSPGHYNVIYGYADETVGIAAAPSPSAWSTTWCRPRRASTSVRRSTFPCAAPMHRVRPRPPPSSRRAVSRDIPYIRLNTASLSSSAKASTSSGSGHYDLEDLVAGCGHRQRQGHDDAPAGLEPLPVPKQETVRTADAAVTAARRIGYPVVVKPLDGNHGRGVRLDLQSEEDVRAGFETAKGESRRGYVIVESFVTGRDYRCLIVGGKMQATAERVPAHVMGDGRNTVSELVEITNVDLAPARPATRRCSPASRSTRRRRLRARPGLRDGRRAPGGADGQARPHRQHVDRRDLRRPHLRRPPRQHRDRRGGRPHAGLDVAGIDFICPDIASPVRETGGAICEVNAAPGFRMHIDLTVGEPQYIAKPVVDLLFSGVAARADRRRHRHQRQDHHRAHDRPHLQGHRRKVGMTSTDVIVIDERLVIKSDASGPRSARMVLQNPPCRLRRHGGRPRRHPARGARLRPQRRRRRHQHRPRPPRHARHRHPRAACGRQGRRRRGRAP